MALAVDHFAERVPGFRVQRIYRGYAELGSIAGRKGVSGAADSGGSGAARGFSAAGVEWE